MCEQIKSVTADAVWSPWPNFQGSVNGLFSLTYVIFWLCQLTTWLVLISDFEYIDHSPASFVIQSPPKSSNTSCWWFKTGMLKIFLLFSRIIIALISIDFCFCFLIASDSVISLFNVLEEFWFCTALWLSNSVTNDFIALATFFPFSVLHTWLLWALDYYCSRFCNESFDSSVSALKFCETAITLLSLCRWAAWLGTIIQIFFES